MRRGRAGRPKGIAKTGGRTKGTPNKVTKAAREAYEEAFEKLGGVDALVKWGKANQTDFYRIHARTITLDVTAKHTGSLAELFLRPHD